MLFVSFSKLKSSPLDTCKQLYNFIGVDDNFIPNLTKKNEAYAQRSIFFEKLLSLIKQSAFTRLVRKILPYRYFYYAARYIENINHKSVPIINKTEFNDSILSILREYYNEENKFFDQLTGIDCSTYY